MLNDSLKTKGVLELKLLDAFGNVKERHEHNVVVNSGLAYIASRMKDATTGVMTHMGVGTSSATPTDKAQTGLTAQLVRVGLDSTTLVTTTATNDAIQYIATFSPGTGTGAITEAGIFNAASAGTMLCRTVFDVINKGALDTLVVTWKVTVA
jgi:hypothetical protein